MLCSPHDFATMHPDSAKHRSALGRKGRTLMQQQHVSQLAPGEGRAVHMSGDTYSFKVVGETSDRMLTLLEGIIPAGSGPPPPLPHREIEYFFLVEGALGIFGGYRIFPPAAGNFRTVPKGALPRFKNVGGEAGKMLNP